MASGREVFGTNRCGERDKQESGTTNHSRVGIPARMVRHSVKMENLGSREDF